MTPAPDTPAPGLAELAEEGRARFGLRAFSADALARAVDDLGLTWTGQEDAAARARVVEAVAGHLAVGETYFFREPRQLARLADELIPSVLAGRAPGHVVRAWSAGCASGEEAYTLAILLQRLGLGSRAEVVGTDMCEALVDRARAARYRPWSFRGVDRDLLVRYFEPVGPEHTPIADVRARVKIHRLNLLDPLAAQAALGLVGLDLILLRNVLIYLEPAAQAALAARMFASLAPGGYLITAAADPPLESMAGFEVLEGPGGVVYRRPAAQAKPEAAPDAARAHDRLSTEAVPVPASPPAVRRAPTASAAATDLAAVQALADRGQGREAEVACEEALGRSPLDAGLHLLHATILVDLSRPSEATAALRRALYLDPGLALAHHLLGTVLRRRGAPEAAAVAFRRAVAILAEQDPGASVAGAGGLSAGALAEWARHELEQLAGDRRDARPPADQGGRRR